MNAAHADPSRILRIRRILARHRPRARLALSACVHCALCAESCFLFRQSGGDPTFAPSYKAIHSIGRILRARGRLPDAAWREVGKLSFRKCVLCMRCYCPLGIPIPSLIAAARAACREAGVERAYDGREEP